MLPYNRKLTEFSRYLRDNSTWAERYLWSRLRMKQVSDFHFYRQKPVGDYIVDFYCPKAKLVIEIDGDNHYLEDKVEEDKLRDAYLRNKGLNVLRFSNSEVLHNIEGVLEKIKAEVEIINPPDPLY